MKMSWLCVLALVLVLGSVGLTACDSSTAAGLSASGQQQGIFVNGEGKSTAVPDIATVSLGIQTQDTTVAQAQDRASSAMDKVMASLAGNGVAKKDIQTQSFSISQVTRYDSKTQQEVVTGYRVSNVVTVKIRNIDKAGSIIDGAAAAGGDSTRVNGINFSVENPSAYYTESRKLAMTDAKAKASQLADLAGVGLGKATYISESSYTPPIAAPVALQAKVASAPSTPISPGEMEITTTVQVTYSIK